jgi:hypothetical protein
VFAATAIAGGRQETAIEPGDLCFDGVIHFQTDCAVCDHLSMMPGLDRGNRTVCLLRAWKEILYETKFHL